MQTAALGANMAARRTPGSSGRKAWHFGLLLSSILSVALDGDGSDARAEPARLPVIITGPANPVPACVTPARLMQFLNDRNRGLKPPQDIDPRFSDVALHYSEIGPCVQKTDGTCIGARWDYAFFQMLIETNYLLYTGGVRPGDNNFAGIGATIPKKPGEVFASIEDGIRAHLQHVLMYAGVAIEQPIAQRTRQVQADVHRKMARLTKGRPVTFSDLATTWVGTEHSTYAVNIDRTAKRFAAQFCKP